MPAQRIAMPPTLLPFLASIMACAELEKACTASTRRAGHTAPEDVRPCIFVSQLGTGYRAEAQSHFSDEATRGELEACDSSLGSWGDPLPPSQPTADERGDLTFDDKRNACLEDYSMPTSTCTNGRGETGLTAGAHERLREDGWQAPWKKITYASGVLRQATQGGRTASAGRGPY